MEAPNQVLSLWPSRPLGLMLCTVQAQRRLAVREIEAEPLCLAHLAAAQQECVSEGVRHLLVPLAQLPEVRGSHPAPATAFLSALVREFPQYDNVAVLGPTTEVLASGIPAHGHVNSSDRALGPLSDRADPGGGRP